jgi:predicted CXXCH cytochrome family protein
MIGVAGGLIGFGTATVAAQESTPSPEPPRDCAECHLDVVSEWQDSIHAQAYHDTVFQSAWQQGGQSSAECLSCHTTGFVPRTGEFDQPGVTCAACHGVTPAEHPPDPVLVDPGVRVCADCHTTTFTEWEHSLHGEQQLACTTCHTPHNQALRFETADALCLNCHDEARDDYAHITHTEQACVDCHWYRAAGETEHIMTGNLMPTGHDNRVETRTCVDCHANLALENGEITAVASSDTHPFLEAQLRIEELEAEVQTAKAQGENQAAVQLIQGLLLGGVAMGLGYGAYHWARRQG